MKLRLPSPFTPALLAGVSFLAALGTAWAQQPAGVPQALATLTSTPSTHTAITFDRDMMASILGEHPVASLQSITVENYHFNQPVFYIPENMAALVTAYSAAGWKHLVQANVTTRDAATPVKPISDIWLHFRGAEIDDVSVLIRAPRQMNIVEVSGLLRPLDLVHLSGHFGIPKVDPDAVMVPAPPGR